VGVIIKESLKQSVVRLCLSALGAVATLFVYSLDRELYGVLGFVLDTGVLLMPLVLIGLGTAAIKFYSYENTSQKDRLSFLWFLLRLLLINILITTGLFFLSKNYLIDYAGNKSSLYAEYFIYILPAAIFFGIAQFLVQYISNFKLVALPFALQSFYRLATPIVFLLIFFGVLNLDKGIIALVASIVLSAVVLFGLLYHVLQKNKASNFSTNQNLAERPKFFNYYFWAFASSLGNLMAFKIDGFMVPSLLDFQAGGDYRIAVFIATVISLPISSVLAISSPIISEAWNKNDMQEIKNIYLKGSKNLIFIGALILLGILILMDALPYFLDSWQALTHIKLIVVIIGISKLIDMLAGVNGVIIQHSNWYRYNTYFILIMVVINVTLNIVLIKSYGINGAAIATAISLAVFNGMKAMLLLKKTKLNPFDFKALIFFLVCGVLIAINLFMEGRVGFWVSSIVNAALLLGFAMFYLFKTDFAIESRNGLLSLKNKF